MRRTNSRRKWAIIAFQTHLKLVLVKMLEWIRINLRGNKVMHAAHLRQPTQCQQPEYSWCPSICGVVLGISEGKMPCVRSFSSFENDDCNYSIHYADCIFDGTPSSHVDVIEMNTIYYNLIISYFIEPEREHICRSQFKAFAYPVPHARVAERGTITDSQKCGTNGSHLFLI